MRHAPAKLCPSIHAMTAQGSTPLPRRIGPPTKGRPATPTGGLPVPPKVSLSKANTSDYWSVRNRLNLSEFEQTVLDDPEQALDRWPTWFRQLAAADYDSLPPGRQFVRTWAGDRCRAILDNERLRNRQVAAASARTRTKRPDPDGGAAAGIVVVVGVAVLIVTAVTGMWIGFFATLLIGFLLLGGIWLSVGAGGQSEASVQGVAYSHGPAVTSQHSYGGAGAAAEQAYLAGQELDGGNHASDGGSCDFDF